jgi:hypothetical protein
VANRAHITKFPVGSPTFRATRIRKRKTESQSGLRFRRLWQFVAIDSKLQHFHFKIPMKRIFRFFKKEFRNIITKTIVSLIVSIVLAVVGYTIPYSRPITRNILSKMGNLFVSLWNHLISKVYVHHLWFYLLILCTIPTIWLLIKSLLDWWGIVPSKLGFEEDEKFQVDYRIIVDLGDGSDVFNSSFVQVNRHEIFTLLAPILEQGASEDQVRQKLTGFIDDKGLLDKTLPFPEIEIEDGTLLEIRKRCSERGLVKYKKIDEGLEWFLTRKGRKFIATANQLTGELKKERLIAALADSENFDATRNIFTELSRYSDFSNQQLNKIISASISNSQVSGIIADEDIRQHLENIIQGQEERIESDNLNGLMKLMNSPT